MKAKAEKELFTFEDVLEILDLKANNLDEYLKYGFIKRSYPGLQAFDRFDLYAIGLLQFLVGNVKFPIQEASKIVAVWLSSIKEEGFIPSVLKLRMHDGKFVFDPGVDRSCYTEHLLKDDLSGVIPREECACIIDIDIQYIVRIIKTLINRHITAPKQEVNKNEIINALINRYIIKTK